MSGETIRTVWRAFMAAALAIAALGFGLMSLCGGVFTASAIAGMYVSGNVSAGLLSIALPCLVIGGVLAILCGWLLLR
ncbi:MAG TPA: hypothetical protein VIN03_20015 [Roseateles sp.]